MEEFLIKYIINMWVVDFTQNYVPKWEAYFLNLSGKKLGDFDNVFLRLKAIDF